MVKPTKRQILKATEIIEGKDAPIVAGAISSKADYLVSFKLKVVTPDEVK